MARGPDGGEQNVTSTRAWLKQLRVMNVLGDGDLVAVHSHIVLP